MNPSPSGQNYQASAAEQLELYKAMRYSRMVEERMLSLLRQGKITKWFSGIGQEAISSGVTLALQKDDLIFPMHRNLGVFTARGVSLVRLLSQWQGKTDGFTKGRDRSFHFGSLPHHIVGMISHLGSQLSLAVGAALAHTLSKSPTLSVAFTGDGGTSEGEFHEALNLASVWQLPVIFIIENNGYALSTPTQAQYRVDDLADKGPGYGMKSFVLDGNNALEVYEFFKSWSMQLRQHPEPIMVECKTFRMRGHEEASGTKYVPDDLLEAWSQRDPIARLKQTLISANLVTSTDLERLDAQMRGSIEEAVDLAFRKPAVKADRALELKDVYADDSDRKHPAERHAGNRIIRYIDAINEALHQAMENDDHLILMGQDIGIYGGVFKATAGLIDQYGAERVRDTPLCESAVIGAAMGLTFAGYSAMVELQFADFISCGFNQVVNNLAKTHYRWGHAVNVTLRLPTGGSVAAGPFHSQNTEAWFLSVPGLKIVVPSNPYDAKGLLMASLQDPNPVLFFEHKYLYRSSQGPVPTSPYTIPLGKAQLVRAGTEATLITYGIGVGWAQEAVHLSGKDIEILDLRTLQPLDYDSMKTSVLKTGRALILHEASLTGGVGAEISAYISEHLFEYLDAPVMRCAGLDTPVPFARTLEEQYLPKQRLMEKIEHLLTF